MIFSYFFIIFSIVNLYYEIFYLNIVILSIIFTYLTKIILFYLFNIDIAKPLDTLLFYSKPYNYSNIVTCCLVNEFTDINNLITYIKDNIFAHPHHQKLKKIINYKFGIWYWTYSKNFDFENHIEILKENMTLDELYEFMSPHGSEIKFDKEKPYWKIFIAPKLFEKKTAIIIKIHHGVADGFSLMSYLLKIGNNNELEFVKMKKITNYKLIFIYIKGFFKFLTYTLIQLLLKKQNNSFNEKPLSGIKNCYCSKSLQLSKLKHYCKQNNIGINDAIMSIITIILKKEYKLLYSKELKNINFCIAASLRPPPNINKNYELDNQVNLILKSLNLECEESDFNKYTIDLKQKLNLNNSYDIYIQVLIVRLFYYLFPPKTLLFLSNLATYKSTGFYTSVPGPINKIKIFNTELEDICFIANATSFTAFVINILTYNGKLIFSCLADNSTQINSKRIVKDFETEYEKLIN